MEKYLQIVGEKYNEKLLVLFSMLVLISLTACSIKEPRLSIGKKCVEKNDSIVYSYLWLFDKQNGLEANKETCKNIRD